MRIRRLAYALLAFLLIPAGGRAGEAPSDAGHKLLDRAVEALGGAARIDAVKAFEQIGILRFETGNRALEIETHLVLAYPDRMRVDMITGLGTITRVLSPGGSFVVSPFDSRALTDEERKHLGGQMQRDLLQLLKLRNDPGLSAESIGKRVVDGNEVEQVRIRFRGVETLLGIDPETGRPVTIAYEGKHPRSDGAGEYVTVLSDFQKVGGILYPFERRVAFDGKPTTSVKSSSVLIDPEVDASTFAPPADKNLVPNS